jgi:hypothetical protein
MKLAIVVDEPAVGTPAQQLRDRLAGGYLRGGVFRRPQASSAAVGEADAVLILPRGDGHEPDEAKVTAAVEEARPGSRLFVYGPLARTAAGARKLLARATARKLKLVAGGFAGTTWRLPPVDVPLGAPVTDALVAVVGAPGEAEWLAVDALLPLVERRARRSGADLPGEAGVRAVRALTGAEIWAAEKQGQWAGSLLSSALSRSDSPQGDTLKDGRTQDLWGLGVVPDLARDPVAYLVEHRDGLRSAAVVVNGVVADLNFAVRLRGAGVVSAQIFRPPAPAAEHYGTLAAVIDDFFATGTPPWPPERAVVAAGLLDAFARARAKAGTRLDTPELAIAYAALQRPRAEPA